MKILVSDFDNTFYTEDIEKNVSLVNDFIAEGNKFIIATGRPLYLLKPELEKYSINYSYLICNDGAVIFNENDEVINKTNLEYFQTIDIYNLLKRTNNFEYVYIDGIYDFAELDAEDYNGILALPIERDKAEMVRKIIEEKYFSVNAHLSHRWLNILNNEASKGKSIKFMIEKENWNENDVYVIGDGLNDMSMTVFKNSFAVNKSNEEFKRSCNNVIDKFSDIFNEIKK